MDPTRESRPTKGAAIRTGEVLDSISAPCQWCARIACAERFNHERLHAASETTWRRATAVMA